MNFHPEYHFIEKPSSATEAIDRLSTEQVLAVDLEADSLHSYEEKVCLLQISSSFGNLVFDPFTCADALPYLSPVFADNKVVKIFHAGDNDIRLLKKQYKFKIHNIFDTMVVSQLTGKTKFGLAPILEEHFGVETDKRYQRANWSARPLPTAQLEYAVKDTAYLIQLRDILLKDLIRLNRLEWAREEFMLLEKVTPTPRKKPWCLDVKGARRLTPRQLAHLQAFLEVRENAARRLDRPPFKVLSTQVLLSWSERPPSTSDDVLETRGAGRSVLALLAATVVKAARRAHSLPLEECPRFEASTVEPLSGGRKKVLRRLKEFREAREGALGLPPGMLVNSATLEKLCRMEPGEAAASLDGVLKKWQHSAAGEHLRNILLEKTSPG